jgi:hypothetical protein
METGSRKVVFRIHPSINFARVGSSPEFYLSPETSAGLPVPGTTTTGGLPIKAGTEDTVIGSEDIRDKKGNLKRQAARFRLFAYDLDGPDRYPSGKGVEIRPGSTLADGRQVANVVWTVHLANKKAAAYIVVNSEGVNAYADGKVPQLRNPETYGDVDSPARLSSLMIDPGPRTILSVGGTSVCFDASTTPSHSDGKGGVTELPEYPVAFPSSSGQELYQPSGPLDTLGELQVDAHGRLLVLPAHGRVAAVYDEYGSPIPLTGDLNNVGWFDDEADGPVSATIVFTDGSTTEAFGAWVVCADPSYAPQIRNVVSVWDDIYDVWVRELALDPGIYDANTGGFNPAYRPRFESAVRPIFVAAALTRWTANLPRMAIQAHEAVGAIDSTARPAETVMAGLTFIRNPNLDSETHIGVPLMPLSVGDAGKNFLAVTKTQYFFLEQWAKDMYEQGAERLGPGESLDMAALSNCLGGRYVPGIEVSYVVRQSDMYVADWQTSGSGPFRIKHKLLEYGKAEKATPFLSGGWIPLHGRTDGLEPGDLSKFMAVPWQTDYNSCSIHQTSINTAGKKTSTGNPSTLFWSWPAQRPNAVFVAEDVVNNVLPPRKWSVRGSATYALNPATAATFQDPLEAIAKWDKIGFVLQGTVIGDGATYAADYYLEVQSLLGPGGGSDVVPEWPFNATVKKS